MTSICTIPVEPSARPNRRIRKERDDFFHSFSVHDAAAAAQPSEAAVVDRHLTGSAYSVAVALRPAFQAGRRTARIQRRLLYQLRHAGRGHYVVAVRGWVERNGSDYGYEPGRDG